MSKADYQTFVATNNISLSSTDLASVFDTEAKTDAYIELYIDRLEQIIKESANTTDTSTTIIGDLRALITKDTTASTVSDLENAFTLSVNNHLSSWGSYLYMSDTLEEGNEENETDQYALAKMTYADLISLIENNPGALSLFISTCLLLLKIS